MIMKSKIIKSILLSVCSIITIETILNKAAIARTIPEIITERGTAEKLTPVRAKTESDWLWGLGGGIDTEMQNYAIERDNSFFRSVESLPSNDRLFNGTNDLGNSLDDSGEAVILRF